MKNHNILKIKELDIKKSLHRKMFGLISLLYIFQWVINKLEKSRTVYGYGSMGLSPFEHKFRPAYRLLPIALFFTLAITFCAPAWADTYKVTAYCSCSKCCGKADGVTASGKVARQGYCAQNWMPFGTLVKVEGMGTYKVMDRGAKSLFGSKRNHIKHIDIWMADHNEARRFGIKYLDVKMERGL